MAPRLFGDLPVRPRRAAVPAVHHDLTFPRLGRSMTIYPANEQRIWEVERGRSATAILPLSDGTSLSAGDSILFALSITHWNQEPCYVKGGDSVRVILTGVTDLGTRDPATGEALFQMTWEPLGQK
jgi:hypothetical protein